MNQRPAQMGFTLLELLIALAVFSLVAAMAYGGLDTVLKAGQHIEQQSNRLRNVQWAMLMLERDIVQLAARPVRDSFGDPLPALRSAALGTTTLELTSGGLENPTQLPKSSLHRVAYGVNDSKLQRVIWPVLDRVPETQSRALDLLDGVHDVRWRFLRTNDEWTDAWPPQNENGELSTELPVAVEITLELDDWGSLRRLIRIPQRGLL